VKKLLLLAVTVISLAGATGASAGSSTLTLTVTPSAPLLGDSLVFTGCGWNATNPNGTQNLVSVLIHQPDSVYWGVTVPVAKSGCFTTAAFPYLVPQVGAFQVYAFQKYRQGALDFIATG